MRTYTHYITSLYIRLHHIPLHSIPFCYHYIHGVNDAYVHILREKKRGKQAES